MNTAMRSQRDVFRGMLADLKMRGALEAVDGILSDIDGGRLAGTAPESNFRRHVIAPVIVCPSY